MSIWTGIHDDIPAATAFPKERVHVSRMCFIRNENLDVENSKACYYLHLKKYDKFMQCSCVRRCVCEFMVMFRAVRSFLARMVS